MLCIHTREEPKVLRSKFFHDEIENMISFLYTTHYLLLEPEIKVKIVPFLTILDAAAYAQATACGRSDVVISN